MQTFSQFTQQILEALNLDPDVKYGLNEPDYDDMEFEKDKFGSITAYSTRFFFGDDVYIVRLMYSNRKGKTELEIEFGHYGSLKKKLLPFAKKKKRVPSNNYFARTGARSALSIFSHVLSIAAVKVKEHNPDRIVFSGADDDLAKSYLNIVNSRSGQAAIDRLGYYSSKVSSEWVIILIRKGLGDITVPASKGGKKGK